MTKKYNFKQVLHDVGEKATKARLSILEALSRETYPVSIKELAIKVKAPNQSTLYRTLETLVDKKIVKEIILDKALARYELSIGRKHHHHIVCTCCGFMEDIDACNKLEETKAAEHSKKFAEITGHSLEFFGTCSSCAHNRKRAAIKNIEP